MAKKLKSTLTNMVIVLGLIAAVTSLLLGFIYLKTKEPIEKSKQEKLNKAIALVVPGGTDIKEYIVINDDATDSLTFYKVTDDNGMLIGNAVKTYSDEGFNGRIVLLVGFDSEGTIIKSFALEQAETPGLGDKMSNSKSNFAEQFEGVKPSEFIFKVKKDKGDVDVITAATISSRAYCNALQKAVDFYKLKDTNAKYTNDEIEEMEVDVTVVFAEATSYREYYVEDPKGGEDLIFFEVKNKKGEIIGTAIHTYSLKGYEGRIELMVGIDNDGNIVKSYTLMQNETPGFGDKIENDKTDFAKQFEGVNPNEFILKIKEEGGDVDVITSTTITTNAYLDAVQRAVDIYNLQKENK